MADHAAANLLTTKPNEKRTLVEPPRASLPPRLQHEPTKLNSTVPFNPRRNYIHHTWAQTFFSRPEFFFQPSSVPELQQIITLARRSRKRVGVTGYGHSPSILTLTSSWLINLDNLNRILEWNVDGKAGCVRFEAGLSLQDLNAALAKKGFTLPNLGSIDVQSVAGAISTGTHGSSLSHGLISQSVTSITILLSNSQLVTCSATKNQDLFRAALLSLGSLGVIVEMTLQAVPDFNISWSQTLHPLSEVLDNWGEDFWKRRGEYTRVWWMPYSQRAVIWSADRTDKPAQPPNTTFYGGALGYYIYHNLLAISNYVPRILPWVEWFVFGMQYGFTPGSFSMHAVEPARQGLLMDCLYSQFVNEWALPLSKGPEAITRLQAWIDGDANRAKIPFNPKGCWVHCPIEVRVSDTTGSAAANASGVRPFLDPTPSYEPTLYLNATLYRPYGKDPPGHARYYEAFEWLMRDLGGRPHWAKNFAYTTGAQLEELYGDDMRQFMAVRDESDPDGMFLGEFHLRNLPVAKDEGGAKVMLLEEELRRRKMGLGWGDGVLWEGWMRDTAAAAQQDGEDGILDEVRVFRDEDEKGGDGDHTPTTAASMTSRASEESFDMMAKGEASVYGGFNGRGGEQ